MSCGGRSISTSFKIGHAKPELEIRKFEDLPEAEKYLALNDFEIYVKAEDLSWRSERFREPGLKKAENLSFARNDFGSPYSKSPRISFGALKWLKKAM